MGKTAVLNRLPAKQDNKSPATVGMDVGGRLSEPVDMAIIITTIIFFIFIHCMIPVLLW